MNDVEKTSIDRQNSYKRTRRRKRKLSAYAFVVVLLVLTVGITVCYTFLFNIDQIVLSGESETYTALEIVEASGVRVGDNLFRIDTDKIEKNVLDNLLYVETVKVEKDFPSSIKISVTRCIPSYNIEHDSGVLLISQKGKILHDNGFYTEGIPVIYGYEPKETTVGSYIESLNENKTSVFSTMMKNFDESDEYIVSAVDMEKDYDITITYDSGMIFKMGNWGDAEYKLNLAESVMQEPTVKGKKGMLTMIGGNQCSFRTSGQTVNIMRIPEETTTVSETGTAETTTTTAVTTSVPDIQEELPQEDYSYYDDTYYDETYYDDSWMYQDEWTEYGYDYGYNGW